MSRDAKKYLIETLRNYKGIKNIQKIQGEASTRAFYRICFKGYNIIAMVYPQKNSAEINRIIELHEIYKSHHMYVPEIKDTYEERILVMEDAGDILFQGAFRKATKNQRLTMLAQVGDILFNLQLIPAKLTTATLDSARMRWEMDFFIEHFASIYLSGKLDFLQLQNSLYNMVAAIDTSNTFAHRDFHSRNMLLHKGQVFLVDFQDSLQAPRHYDLVSFAFDSYLELKDMRKSFLQSLGKKGLPIDEEQLFLTAIQRNIKALGTFGYQISVRKNLGYKKYIARTLRHLRSNRLFDRFLPKFW